MDDEGNAADDAMTELLERAGIQSSATMNLIVFSFLMFTVPLSVMYVTYRYLFIGKLKVGAQKPHAQSHPSLTEYLHLTRDRAALYAGVMGIAVVSGLSGC